jgi:enoyl-[acyl-carrier protein] reductase II
MRSNIASLLNIRYPLIQGGMAWVSNASLAAAVSKAGALGVIAAGNAPPDWVRAQIRELRSKTDNPRPLCDAALSPYVDAKSPGSLRRSAYRSSLRALATPAGYGARVEGKRAVSSRRVVASSALRPDDAARGSRVFLIAEGCEAGRTHRRG